MLKLSQHLLEVLKNNLEAIPFLLRVKTNVANLRIATEKYFGTQANYNKVSLRVTSFFATFHPAIANANPFVANIIYPTIRERVACSIGSHTCFMLVGIYIF